MRIARVIGKVTLNSRLPELQPGSYLIVRPCNRAARAGVGDGNDESEVLYDCLSAREGDLVGLVEGREATAPFYPEKVPYNAYNACILETVNFQPILDVPDSPHGA